MKCEMFDWGHKTRVNNVDWLIHRWL